MIKPLIISGPSGVGKTYLEKFLIANYNFKRIQSTITRPRRPGEIDGIDYNFISEEEYKRMEKEGKFIISTFVLNCWRGFEKKRVEEIIAENKIPITVVVPTVVPQFISSYPQTVAIYLKPETSDFLINRLQSRGDSPELISQRIHSEQEQNDYFKQIMHLYKKTYIINANNFSSLVADILAIIQI